MNMAFEVVSDTLTPALKKLAQHMMSAIPAMHAVSMVLDRSVKRNFRAEGRPEKWQQLAASTARTKRTKSGKRRGYAHILRDTGRLIQSIQTHSGATFAEIGTPLKYAGAHQFGTTRAGRGHHTTIPKRTFIGASDQPVGEFRLVTEDEQDVAKAINYYLCDGQEATGV